MIMPNKHIKKVIILICLLISAGYYGWLCFKILLADIYFHKASSIIKTQPANHQEIISYLTLKDKLDFCVRTGSVNAAHTVWMKGNRYALHMVPAAFLNQKCRLLIGAGANVHVAKFLEEVELTKVKDRIGVGMIDALEASASEQGWSRSGPLVLFAGE